MRAQVAEEPAPAPQGFEWQALAQSIEALVARMNEATIARFVALEKAEETDRLRSQFLANMSHDLRSPLNSILGFSSLLLRGVDGTLDGETREMVETIAAAGRDLLQQIDAILDMARIEARRIEKQAEPVPLAPLISKAVQRARNRGGDHINYTVEAVPGLPTAYIDPRHLVQALENLLLFAGKRLTGGSLNIKLRRGDPDAPLGLQLHVTTPLKPASEQQMGLARKGFHRLPGHRGLGLELPIADALLKIEGCRLDVREVGQAMVFKIHLPAAEARSRVPLIERAHPAADSTAPPT
ncbi:sensor histidine kinase [Nannocystis pusilla]|uniref:sensor histidine kinase n=1 Tax=Nannocystis pusilla TaxID=889268 RepID=UPI003B76755E